MRRHMGRGIWKEASARRHLGGCILEASGMKHLGVASVGGICEEASASASARRHMGGCIWEEASGRRRLREWPLGNGI